MKKGENQTPSGCIRRYKHLRRRLMVFWILLTLAVFGTIMLALSVTGWFTNTEQRLKDGLDVQIQSTGENLKSAMDHLTAQSIRLSQAASQEIEALLVKNGISFSELNDSPEYLLELQQALYAPVNTVLHTSNCNGAYAVLDATANTQAEKAEHSRSGLYLRCVNITGNNPVDPDVAYFRGIPDVARQKGTELHNRWNLEFDVSQLPGYFDLVSQKVTRPADHYYWTERIELMDTWEEAILLCVPIVGDNKKVYGACGVEVSSLFFRLAFPVKETEFGSAATVLAPIENGKLMLNKGLIGGVSGTYLDKPDELSIHQGRFFNTYIGSTEQYIGVQRLVDISMDSEERQWAAALLLPKQDYEVYASNGRRALILRCLAILVILILMSVLLYWRFVLPFESEIHSAPAGKQTFNHDLSCLLDFVSSRPPSQPFDAGDLPAEITEALDRFLERAASLKPEEQRIFRLLAEGCEPQGLSARTGLSRYAAERRLSSLCEGLGLDSVDDVLLYMDFFRHCGRKEQIERI